jgi:aspartyl-tRNA synthetase
VPSRLHPGKFYALPQAPQQFKQLLMVSGFDKYFQIAPCFRDEDPRADRSPTDFYQLDMEMSFVEQEDVFQTIEPVLKGVFHEFGGGRTVDEVWPRISYKRRALWYGTDKPDLRNPVKMQVVSEHFAGSGFAIFAKILEHEGTEVRAIPAPGGGSRKFCDRMNSWAQGQGLPGMGYIFWREGEGGALEGAGPLAKNIGPERTEAIRQQLHLHKGDAVFFVAGKPQEFEGVAGRARDEIGRELGLIDESRFAFAWIVDFPMYEKDEETGRVDFSHNPFSMPQGGLDALGRSAGGAGLPVRSRLQRLRDRLGRDPEPQARDHVQGLRTGGLRRGRGAQALRRHGQRLPLRRAAPWRLRGGDRPDRDASGRHREHPGGHPVPDEPAGRGPDDERPVRAHGGTADGAGLRVIPQD